MARNITLDSGGMAAMLKSAPVASAVRGAAGQIAAAVSPDLSDGTAMTVEVWEGAYRDRAVASVVLAHPAGLRHHAKYGTLTRAAAGAGA